LNSCVHSSRFFFFLLVLVFGVFFFVVLGFELRASHLWCRSLPLELFYQTFCMLGSFKIGSHFFPGRPKTWILLISASQVARITGVSHWLLAHFGSFSVFLGVVVENPNIGRSYAPNHLANTTLIKCIKRKRPSRLSGARQSSQLLGWLR
jgi:hypothetical protein